MIIYLNDHPLCLETPCTLKEMLDQANKSTAHVAIALNNQFIPKTMFARISLIEGDRIDLIQPMQGG